MSKLNGQSRWVNYVVFDILIFNGEKPCLDIIDVETITDTLSEAVMVQIMTVDELREKAGLPPLEPNQVPSSQVFGEDIDFDAIEAAGYNDEDLEFLGERSIDFNPFKEEDKAEKMEAEFISTVGLSIISLLRNNPAITLTEIANALGRSVEEVQEELNTLREDGDISVSDSGEITVEVEEEAEPEELIVVYKYIERPDAPALKTQSRDFCVNMVRLSRSNSWTRDQIRLLSNGQGSNVFTHRGGWYHNPTTGINTPYCRHIWSPRLVRIRK